MIVKVDENMDNYLKTTYSILIIENDLRHAHYNKGVIERDFDNDMIYSYHLLM